MRHQDIYKQYQCCFPQYAERTERWFPNGKNSIRVRQNNKMEFIFSYENEQNWGLETKNHFLRSMKGEM